MVLWEEVIQLHRTRFTTEEGVSEPVEVVAADDYRVEVKPRDPYSMLNHGRVYSGWPEYCGAGDTPGYTEALAAQTVPKNSSALCSAGVRISRGRGPSFTIGKFTIVCSDNVVAAKWMRRLERRAERRNQRLRGQD